MPRTMRSRNKARGTIAKFTGGKVKVRRSIHTSSGAPRYPRSHTYKRYTITKRLVRRKGR